MEHEERIYHNPGRSTVNRVGASAANAFTLAAPVQRGNSWLARAGEAMVRHRKLIQTVQWVVVVFYLSLVTVPAFLPLPPQDAHLWDNLRLFAQFVFWGLWWPGVMLATLTLGRVWCGVFCPEGTITEWASHHGLGRPVPRWMKWAGWPFVAFVCTTVYGQLVSVYEYPQAVLLVLGGSTLAALAVGLIYGRGKRIWCRHLCPASGVFALLAKVAPLHFRVDRTAWERTVATPSRATMKIQPVNCAPLVDIRRMTSASECHACGRCAGHRDAVQLVARRPWQEIVALQSRATTAEAMTLLFGILGIASATFQWTVNPWFVQVKIAIAEWLVERDAFTLLQDNAPWWLLTHYPEANDVFTWLDGLLVLGYIGGVGTLLGGAVWAGLALAARCIGKPRFTWQRLSLALVPLGGISVFVGLSMLTMTLLKAEHIVLTWLPELRATLLGIGLTTSAWLGVQLIAASGGVWYRRLAASACLMLSLGVIGWNWYQVFFVW